MAEPSSREGAHHLVLPRSGRLVVLFSGTNKPDKAFDFWGFAQRTTSSVVLLNNGRNLWYQNGVPGFGDSVDGTTDLLKQWSESLNATEICCIGASMGGSAAVMFGCKLDARVLAFSFESHIRHPGSRSLKYIPANSPLQYPDLTSLIECSARPITSLTGSADVIDLIEAYRLRDIKQLDIGLLRGVDHGVPRYLRNVGKLDAVLNAFVNSTAMPALADERADLDRPGYVEKVEASHLAYLDDRLDESYEHAMEANAAHPSAFAPHFLAGKALLKLRRASEAATHLGFAMGVAPMNEEARLQFGRALRHLRQFDHAIEVHSETLTLYPTNHRVLYDQSLALWAAGGREEALSCMRRALKIAPTNSTYLARHQKFETAVAS